MGGRNQTGGAGLDPVHVHIKSLAHGGDGVAADFDWVQGVDAVGLYVNVFDLKLQRLYNGAGGIEVTEYLNLKPSTPRWTRAAGR